MSEQSPKETEQDDEVRLREPVNTEPPYIPDAEIYDTHRPGEWIAIADSVYADVVNGSWMENYHMSFVGLEGGKLWVHITTAWRDA